MLKVNASRTLAILSRDEHRDYDTHYIWCEGCKHCHGYQIGGNRSWSWDGNEDLPTYLPSYREFINFPGETERTLCHFHVSGGVIDYLADSSNHQIRGKRSLVRIPAGYGISSDEMPE